MLFVFFVLGLSVTTTSVIKLREYDYIHPREDKSCQNLTSTTCWKFSSGKTIFPNLLGISDPDVVESNLDAALQRYNCEQYVLKHSRREYRESYQRVCSPVIRYMCDVYYPNCTFGIQAKPDISECRKFQNAKTSENIPAFYCDLILDPGDKFKIDSDETNDPTCRPMTESWCSGLYNEVSLPNRLQLGDQGVITKALYSFFPFIDDTCSTVLRPFLCQLFLPRCEPTRLPGKLPSPPSQQDCVVARDVCTPVMKSKNQQWPDYLDCSQFHKNDGENKQGTTFKDTSPTPNIQDDCPPLFERVNDVCYHVNSNLTTHVQMSWVDARAACQQMANNSDLTSFGSEDELRDFINRFGSVLTDGSFWTGANFNIASNSALWIHNGQPIIPLSSSFRVHPISNKYSCGTITTVNNLGDSSVGQLVHGGQRCGAPHCTKYIMFGYICRVY